VALTRASGVVAHLVGRAHVAPHKAAGFAGRIGLVLEALEQRAVGRLRRHLDDVAFDVEFPAVIEAAQAAFLVAREHQRGAAVRAEFVEHADAAFGVTEDDEAFAKQAHADRRAVRFGNLLGQAGGDPVPPHDLAHRGVAFDAAEQVVFFGAHGAFAPVWLSAAIALNLDI
jgi:hypothetical protein